MSANCRTHLIFVPQGVKIDSKAYRELILESEVKHAGSKLFKNEDWIFQQEPQKPLNRGYGLKILNLFERKSGHPQVQILTLLTILYGGHYKQGPVQSIIRV